MILHLHRACFCCVAAAPVAGWRLLDGSSRRGSFFSSSWMALACFDTIIRRGSGRGGVWKHAAACLLLLQLHVSCCGRMAASGRCLKHLAGALQHLLPVCRVKIRRFASLAGLHHGCTACKHNLLPRQQRWLRPHKNSFDAIHSPSFRRSASLLHAQQLNGCLLHCSTLLLLQLQLLQRRIGCHGRTGLHFVRAFVPAMPPHASPGRGAQNPCILAAPCQSCCWVACRRLPAAVARRQIAGGMQLQLWRPRCTV